MPEITGTSTQYDGSQGFLNVSRTVGRNGVNHLGDVLLVQAMLYEILPPLYGIIQEDLPYPTGAYEARTARAILKYQELSSLSRNVKVWKDGFIDRAVGSHVPGKKRVWTITYMNEDLYYVHYSGGYDGSYIDWLFETYPALQYYSSSYN